MVREPNGIPDAYFLSAITKFLVWCGLLGKSEESDLEKGKKGSEKPGHKYIRRKPKKTGKAGYDYIYKEPEGKGPKKDENGKKPTMMEQLAAIIGKKQGGEEEKKPKKQFPWDEFSAVPPDMPDFRKGMTAAQWTAELDRMVTKEVANSFSYLDDADYDLLNDRDKPNSLYVDMAIKMIESARSAYSSNAETREGLLVENKKLDDNAQREVKNGIIIASAAICNIAHMTSVFNSSIAENVFDNYASKLDSDKFRLSHYSKFDKLSTVVAVTKNNLEYLNDSMQNIQWLQGSDPKLDWLVDKVYEAADELMTARNRFAKNGLRFFVDQLTPRLESLKDAEEVQSTLKLIEQFEMFINEVIHSSTTARNLGVFANQWNMKQKGVYDSASRFSAYATGKVLDKIKSLESLGNDDILSEYIEDVAKNPAFAFLSMSPTNEPFRVSEQVFSYIDMHGMDKYYQDMVFLTGGRKAAKIKNASPEHLRATNIANHYPDSIATLTKAYNGEDVYHDDDALFQSEQAGGGMGSLKKGKYAAIYTAMNTMILMNKNAPMASKVPAFIRMWSSASHNSLMSNAIEEFVNEKGIDRGSYVNYHIATNRTVSPRRQSTRDALAETIKGVYNNTQKEMGSKSKKLFRGNGDSEIKSIASSWTPVDHIAANFGHVVSMVEAPAESILLANTLENEDYWSYPNEREYVLVPGLLSADKKLQPEQLLSDQRQKILDSKLELDAEAYSEAY